MKTSDASNTLNDFVWLCEYYDATQNY